MHYNFNKDIYEGEQGEVVVLNDLLSIGAEVVQMGNNDNRYDFVISHKGNNISYECKTDFYKDTGNLFVETKSWGKLSGINVTKADWFVTYFKNKGEIWYIKTDKLKNLISDYVHKYVQMVGDENSSTEGFLIRKNDFRDWFIVRIV